MATRDKQNASCSHVSSGPINILKFSNYCVGFRKLEILLAHSSVLPLANLSQQAVDMASVSEVLYPIIDHPKLSTSFKGLRHSISSPEQPVWQFRGIKYGNVSARFQQSSLNDAFSPSVYDATTYGYVFLKCKTYLTSTDPNAHRRISLSESKMDSLRSHPELPPTLKISSTSSTA
jgi:hypothetical protein